MGGKATTGNPTKRKRAANESTSSKSQDTKQDATPPNPPMGSMGPVVPKNPDLICPHLTYVRVEKLKRKILTPTAWSCSECGTTEGVWACLTCGKIGCGRYQSEHALSHYEDYQHPLAFEINLSYCYCYQCDQYVTQDNKKEDLETIRKLILKAQTVDDHSSTTRSGKAIRPPVKIPTSSEFQDEDRLHTAVKHWRLLTLSKAFNSWKAFKSEQRRAKQLADAGAASPEFAKSDAPSSIPATPPPAVATPPPLARVKTNFLTQSTQRALASPSSSRIIPGITGLRNLGNTCFMNTVLQALSNTSEFRDFFVHMLGATQPKDEETEEITEKVGRSRGKAKAKGKEKEPAEADEEDVLAVVLNGKRYTRQPTLQLLDTIRKHVPKFEEVSLAMEMHSLFRVLWSGKWAVVTPCALLESVWKFVPKFRNRQQQDAQEFLCYLFDRLQLELAHANSALGPAPAPELPAPTQRTSRQRAAKDNKDKDKESNSNENSTESSRRKRGRSPSPPPSSLPPMPLSGDQTTIITETFQGKLCSMVICETCKNTSTKLDPFLDLSVDIPVVSIAKPHRRKRSNSKAKTKTKPKSKTKTKTKTKQNGAKDEPAPSSPTQDTTSSEKDNTTTDKTDDTATPATPTTPTTTTSEKTENTDENVAPSTSTPPTSSTSDSESDHGPLSCDLADCLASFIKEEKVEGYACEKCDQKREAVKRLYIHTLPHVLCIVLKRFAWTATSRSKIDTHVSIPFTLDVSDYMIPQEKKENDKSKDEKKAVRGLYELKSVVMHHGVGLLSGHYTSFCYNELQDTWVHYNDARVGLVTREQVEKDIPAQAYLMFYQRTFPSTGPYFAPIFPLLPSISSPSDPPPSSSSPPPSPYAPPPPTNPTTTTRPKRLKR